MRKNKERENQEQTFCEMGWMSEQDKKSKKKSKNKSKKKNISAKKTIFQNERKKRKRNVQTSPILGSAPAANNIWTIAAFLLMLRREEVSLCVEEKERERKKREKREKEERERERGLLLNKKEERKRKRERRLTRP